MDSNILNTEGLPDANELQRLANEYLRATSLRNPQDQASPITERDPFWNYNAEKDFSIPGQSPASVAGSGISPSAINQNNIFNISDPQTSLPDPHFSDGRVPSSVAGSGISPSAVNDPHRFTISDPQTSLPDPHFTAEGKNPGSVSGSGVSPSFTKNIDTGSGYHWQDSPNPNWSGSPVESSLGIPYSVQHLPYSAQLPFEAELKSLLNYAAPFVGSPQIPGPDASLDESSFYFLSGANDLSFLRDAPGSLNSKTPKENQLNILPKLPFDVNRIKRDFPILQERVNGRQLVWLDNAATTQKPKQVIDG